MVFSQQFKIFIKNQSEMSIKILHIISGLNDGGAESLLFNFLCNSENNMNFVIS